MPVISVFFGIVIRMHFREHESKHFHAEHQAQEGKFDFDGNPDRGQHHFQKRSGTHSAVGSAQPSLPRGELV
jgi:hypothetical protein